MQFDDILNFFPGNFSGAYVFQSLAGFNGGVPNRAGDTYTQAFPGDGTTGRRRVRTRRSMRFSCRIVAADARDHAQRRSAVRRAGLDTAEVRTPTRSWPRPASTPASSIPTRTTGVRGSVGVGIVGPLHVRGGYGIFYGRTPAIMVGTAHSNNGINVQTITFRGANGDPVPTYPNRFASIPQGVTLPLPTIFTFDASSERARPAGQRRRRVGRDAAHVGPSPISTFAATSCRGRRTSISVARSRSPSVWLGPPRPSRTTNSVSGPFSRFARVISFQSTAESTYDGLTLELNRRFSQGLHYRVAYTVGKVEDTVPDATAVVPEGFDDRKYASNPSDFEVDLYARQERPAPSRRGECRLCHGHLGGSTERMVETAAERLESERDLHSAEGTALQCLCQHRHQPRLEPFQRHRARDDEERVPAAEADHAGPPYRP